MEDNSTTIPYKCVLETEDKILLAGYVIVFLIGVIGNILVLIIYKKYWRKGPVLEMLILYLGMADLLSSICSPLLFTYWIFTCYSWHLGSLLCKVLPGLVRILTNLSFIFILLMAVDRYKAIVKPFHGRWSNRKVHFLASISCIMAVAWEIHYIYFLEVVTEYGESTCNIFDYTYIYPVLSIVFTLGRDFIFIIVMLLTSGVSYLTLRRSDRRQKTTTIRNGVNNTERTQNRSKDIINLLMWMFVISCVAILPRDLLQIAYSFGYFTKTISDSKAVLLTNSILKLLQTSNSIYNVFIYAGKHDGFWSEVLRLVCRRDEINLPSLPSLAQLKGSLMGSTDRVDDHAINSHFAYSGKNENNTQI